MLRSQRQLAVAQVTARAEQTTVCSAFFIWSTMRTTNDVLLNNIYSVCSRGGLVVAAHAEFRRVTDSSWLMVVSFITPEHRETSAQRSVK